GSTSPPPTPWAASGGSTSACTRSVTLTSATFSPFSKQKRGPEPTPIHTRERRTEAEFSICGGATFPASTDAASEVGGTPRRGVGTEHQIGPGEGPVRAFVDPSGRGQR